MSTRGLLAFLVTAIKNGSFIVGVLALLLVDLVLGASYYGSAIGDNANLNFLGIKVSGTQFGWGLSIATTAMQIVLWDILESHGRSLKSLFNSVASIAATCAILVLTVVDTVADLGALTQSIYPDTTDSLALLPPDATPGYWVIALVVLVMTLFNEPILGVFVLNGKKPAPSMSLIGD